MQHIKNYLPEDLEKAHENFECFHQETFSVDDLIVSDFKIYCFFDHAKEVEFSAKKPENRNNQNQNIYIFIHVYTEDFDDPNYGYAKRNDLGIISLPKEWNIENIQQLIVSSKLFIEKCLSPVEDSFVFTESFMIHNSNNYVGQLIPFLKTQFELSWDSFGNQFLIYPLFFLKNMEQRRTLVDDLGEDFAFDLIRTSNLVTDFNILDKNHQGILFTWAWRPMTEVLTDEEISPKRFTLLLNDSSTPRKYFLEIPLAAFFRYTYDERNYHHYIPLPQTVEYARAFSFGIEIDTWTSSMIKES